MGQQSNFQHKRHINVILPPISSFASTIFVHKYGQIRQIRYFGAQNMVKWGVPEKILQTAVHMRWPCVKGTPQSTQQVRTKSHFWPISPLHLQCKTRNRWDNYIYVTSKMLKIVLLAHMTYIRTQKAIFRLLFFLDTLMLTTVSAVASGSALKKSKSVSNWLANGLFPVRAGETCVPENILINCYDWHCSGK